MVTSLKLATRGSQLALWQANHVRDQLINTNPELSVDIVVIQSEGDQIQDRSLAEIGGKGLFIKALEQALLDGSADFAVHSLKDVPPQIDSAFMLPAVLQRADPRDALISPKYGSIDQLPENALIGTCSVRRQCQLLKLRPDLQMVSLRGNVDTRINKCHAGDFDAIVLAAAGLQRLDRLDQATQIFSIEQMIPSVGQGAIAIQCRAEDQAIASILAQLNHYPTSRCVSLEREAVERLQGNCHSPIGAHAWWSDENQLSLSVAVGNVEQKQLINFTQSADDTVATKLPAKVVDQLIEQGASDLLR
jgi:hydroxymethylbilane synthase